jgi:hypothetical protein
VPTNRRPTVRQRAARRRKRERRVAERVVRAFRDGMPPEASVYELVDARMRSAYVTLGAWTGIHITESKFPSKYLSVPVTLTIEDLVETKAS